jgi:cell division protein ZapE
MSDGTGRTPRRSGATTPAATGLRATYAEHLRERGFKEDAAQLAAVAQLDDLRTRLLESHASASFTDEWLTRLGVRKRRGPQRGVYLHGGVGRGKTWLMDLFFQSLPFPEKRRRHFYRFMHDVHDELKKLARRESPLDRVADRIAREARILCFDELFVTDIADAMILGNLFGALFKRGVTLVATSNVPPRELYKGGLQRERFLPAIDLLEKHTRVVPVAGDTDYRLRQLTQAGTYLSSKSPDTPQRLAALFTELADGDPGNTGSVEIEDRRIPIVKESDNVVWFEFSALCEGPRSQNDYIEIARDYQSVILSNVPTFSSRKEDSARRFIALVDEFYDRNVNLVVSAAAPPADLYKGERLAFEFQRTSSRLVEMQSEEYLAREHRP